MKLLSYKFLLVLIYLISTVISFAEELDIKNLVIHKENKKLSNITFTNINNELINLKDFSSKLIVLNFWATWCAPCREEMPSLDKLQELEEFQNLKVIPVNIGQEKVEKSLNFFSELSIKNLDLYFDNSVELAKTFSLRGLPTTVLINKDGEEFARIVGSIDFGEEKFIKWLSKFN